VTIAIRPLSGVDGGGYKVICYFGKPEYFFGWDWTGRNSLIPFRKLDFTRKCVGCAGERNIGILRSQKAESARVHAAFFGKRIFEGEVGHTTPDDILVFIS